VWRFLRGEPLVHFFALGLLIFAADAFLSPPKKNDHTIVVSKALRQSFIDNFDEDRARTPSQEELQKMIDSWVASEILYREGKAMAVDRGDEMIRDRIAYKLQLLIFDQVKVPKPTEQQLNDWFAKNHARFDEPERVGFYLTPASNEESARRALQDIQAQRESPDLQKQTRAIIGRPLEAVTTSFGKDFSNNLLELPAGQWSVLQSKEGWHVVRLDSRHAGKQAQLDDVRDEAIRLWHTDETRQRAWEAVNRLKAQYVIEYEK
jgi:parvulin-like peptidyl-prolyl isomerase